jgi:hypothetical protein
MTSACLKAVQPKETNVGFAAANYCFLLCSAEAAKAPVLNQSKIRMGFIVFPEWWSSKPF